VVGGAERVAAVLDEHQAVAAAEVDDRAEVERVAQRVGDHDGARAVGDGRLHRLDVDVVGGQRDVHEHRHEAVLDDRVDGRGEAGGDGDDLVTRLQLPVAQARRGQGAHGGQVGRRARVDHQRVAQPRGAGQLALEALVLGARGEPAVEARAHEFDDLRRPDQLAGDRHRRVGGIEDGRGMALGRVLGDELENLVGGGSHPEALSPRPPRAFRKFVQGRCSP
jgi:hypothetical protein